MSNLIVTVRRRAAVEQPRERELLRGGVPIDHLPGNVQENVAPFLVHVFQGAVRHEEEIQRSQSESVRGCGGDGGTYLLNMDGCCCRAIVAFSHTIHVT